MPIFGAEKKKKKYSTIKLEIYRKRKFPFRRERLYRTVIIPQRKMMRMGIGVFSTKATGK